MRSFFFFLCLVASFSYMLITTVLRRTSTTTDKPLLGCFLAWPGMQPLLTAAPREEGGACVPAFASPEPAARTGQGRELPRRGGSGPASRGTRPRRLRRRSRPRPGRHLPPGDRRTAAGYPPIWSTSCSPPRVSKPSPARGRHRRRRPRTPRRRSGSRSRSRQPARDWCTSPTSVAFASACAPSVKWPTPTPPWAITSAIG